MGEQESETRTRVQYSLIMAGTFLAVWVLLSVLLGDESLVRSVGIGMIGALTFGGLHYVLDSRSS